MCLGMGSEMGSRLRGNDEQMAATSPPGLGYLKRALNERRNELCVTEWVNVVFSAPPVTASRCSATLPLR
ncbi:MAG: hypothetical protein CMN64_19095 [Sphingobium sp.]|nr:hypothetical protein [Sphingobium sp.]